MQTRQGTAHEARDTLQQRGAQATRNLRVAMQMPTHPKDEGILGIALAEVAAGEGRRNPQFASDVRQRYDELIDLRNRAARRASQHAQELPPLEPIRRDLPYRKADPFAPPNPEYLIQVYGKGQLARALHDYTVDQLKRTAKEIEHTHPGTKPTNRGQRASLIAYIVAYA